MIDIAQEAAQTVILAGDEASLYLQATLQVVWHPCGQTPMLKVHPGRESIHFYGALNLATGEETAMPAKMMNGDVSALFLLRLLQSYPSQPILLLWDKATWHRGAAVAHILHSHPRLEILYLPTATPDLNPQEHVWKATRQAVSHNHRHAKLDQLAAAFEHHLHSTRFPCSLLDNLAFPSLSAMFT